MEADNDADLQVAQLALPLQILHAAIRFIGSFTSWVSLSLTVSMSSAQPEGPSVPLQIVPAIFSALQSRPLASVTLSGLLQDPPAVADSVTNLADRSFGLMAPNLRELHLTSLCWLAYYPKPVVMPKLEKLSLVYGPGSYGRTTDRKKGLQRLPDLVNACGTRLKSLCIDFSQDFENGEVPAVGRDWPLMRCPHLEKLQLKSDAFACLKLTVLELPCHDVSIAVRDANDWTNLLVLLRAPYWLPGMKKLQIEHRSGSRAFYPSAAPPFDEIRAAAQDRKIDLTVAVTGSSTPLPIEDFMDYLTEFQQEVASMYYSFPILAFDPFTAYRSHRAIVLSKCTHLDWHIREKLEDQHLG